MFKTLFKWILGLVACSILAAVGYLQWFKNGVDFIYGAHTQEVAHGAFATPQELLAITNANVLAPDGKSMVSDQTVVIAQGEIIAVGADVVVPANATIISGQDKFIIPGLVDAHAHLLKSPNDLLLYVANGVTHIRDLGGPNERLQLRREIEQGRIGPKLFLASPPIDSMDWLAGSFWELITFHKTAQSTEQALRMVKEFHQQGYDAIKIYHLDMESYRAVNKLAGELGIPTTGHFPLTLELSELAITEQREVAHLEEIVRVLIREFGSISEQGTAAFYEHVAARSDAIIDDLLANDITVNSVLWFMESIHDQYADLEQALKQVPIAYANPGLVEGTDNSDEFKVGWLPGFNQFEATAEVNTEQYRKSSLFWQAREQAHRILLQAMIQRGVRIVAGTDAGANLVVPGFSLHDELYALNQAGMTPAQALASATITPAQLMNSNAGIVQQGFRADLLILTNNPLQDIRNTRSIESVILNGRWLQREKLDAMLTAVKQANDNSRLINIDQYR
ncbi:MAG: amidohydrolase family protein [Gammaproteobacteria bacterium]|nr:amidohydrolase family protein [Gammaproteobacteria bacterium]NVK89019.1 amidohydrolase family protein [Gammaproteobacteria bacterium]